MRLFCLPHAGGGASSYRQWCRTAPPQVEVCPVQLPGREARIREAPFRRVEEAVAALKTVLQPHLDRPSALFGYSMGALLAYELTLELARSCETGPTVLFAAAAGAPSSGSSRSERQLHALPDAAFKDALRELSGTPDAVLEHEELMELMLPVLRADFELHETYRPRSLEPVPCPLVAFGGDKDPNVPIEDLRAWARCTSGRFRSVVYPGHHFFFETAGAEMLEQVVHTLQAEATNSERSPSSSGENS